MARKLCIELLEDRVVMASDAGMFLSEGVLRVEGTNIADTAEIRIIGDQIKAQLNGQSANFRAVDVSKIVFRGNDGNDSFVNYSNIAAQAYGGAGDDVFNASYSSGNHQLYGEGGNDTLYAGQGSDLLDGGDGDDVVNASYGSGTNLLYGGAGDDRMY